jgi:hypothetical protein
MVRKGDGAYCLEEGVEDGFSKITYWICEEKRRRQLNGANCEVAHLSSAAALAVLLKQNMVVPKELVLMGLSEIEHAVEFLWAQ